VQERSADAEQETAVAALFDAGSSRVDEWTPTLAPQYGIALGVGSLAKRAMANGDDLAVRPTLKLCLAFDHIQFDRESAAALLEQFVLFLEEPESLVFL
jgi:pyruvate dehydrogenase E2 component (dihydrolipoamide acetyltransferase)